MDLQLLFRLLVRKKWILISVPLLAVICALLIQIFSEWKFRSTAQLATGITINDELIDKGSRFNAYEIQVTFINLMEAIKSRAVINQLSYQLLYHDLIAKEKPFRKQDPEELEEVLGLDLEQYKNEFTAILKDKIDSLTSLRTNNPFEKKLEGVIKAYRYDYESLLKDLDVARVNISDYIEVEYVSENRSLSAYVVNTVCSEFIRYYSSVKLSSSSVSLESLSSIAEQRRQLFDSKVEELRVFRANNEIIGAGTESESKLRQIQQYEEQIESERQHLRGFQLTVANLESRLQEATAPFNNRQNEEIVTLRRRINTLNDKYTSGGQRNKVLLDSVTLLRRSLQTLLQRSAESSQLTPAELNDLRNRRDDARVSLEASRENLASLTNIVNTIRYGIGNYANKEAMSEAIEREVEVARTEYLAAQGRYNEAKEKVLTDRFSITQVVRGEPAEKPESRKTIIFMIFSGIISFSVCIFVIILLEVADARIRTPQRLKQLTKLNVAGIIPSMPKAMGALNWNFFFKNGKGVSKQMNTLNHSLRKIRYEIESHNVQVLLVTSTQIGQGKTFFTMAMAHSLSHMRKRILIIDANLRNNSLTRLIAAPANLKQLIDHHNQVSKQLKGGQDEGQKEDEKNYYGVDLITRTSNDFVDIIGSKISPYSPSEVIPAGDFKVLIEWLKVRYDYIILEGAALNEFSDSRELVRFADLVIPVFSANASLTDEDKESIEFLASLREQLGPAILNNFQSEEK